MKFLICIALAFLAVDARHHRLTRNAAEDGKVMIENFLKGLPTEDLKAVFVKLNEYLGEEMPKFQAKLAENEDKLDMTLDQFRDKLGDRYPGLKQSVESYKAKMDTVMTKLDSLTIKDLLSTVMERLGVSADPSAQVDKAAIKDNMMKIKTMFFSLLDSVQNYQPNRRVRREIGAGDIKALIASFPREEFSTFWDKLSDAAGDHAEQMHSKLGESGLDMDKTLMANRELLGDRADQVEEAYAEYKGKVDTFVKKMDTMTFKDVFVAIREKLAPHISRAQAEGIPAMKLRREQFKTFIMNFFDRLANYVN